MNTWTIKQFPTDSPTMQPTNEPTLKPSLSPTTEPTQEPSLSTTTEPSLEPSSSPTIDPTTYAPSQAPSMSPVYSTEIPSRHPTSPTGSPSKHPSESPTTESPTVNPSTDPFVLRHSGGTCVDIIEKDNYEYVDLGEGVSEADCAARCAVDAQCDFYQTLNHHAYSNGWLPLCQHYRNAYCDPATLTNNHDWLELAIKESGILPVKIVTSGPPMTASCSSQALDYCLKTTWEGGNSAIAPWHNTIWRLADVLHGEPVFVRDEKETENNGALGFIPDFNQGIELMGYCADQTWGAIVLDKSPEYPFINDGNLNLGIAGSCTGTETADILEVLRGQKDSISTAFRARTNSYEAAFRDVKIEVVRDVMACGGRFYSDALFSKSESEQCAIMEAVLPKAPTASPTSAFSFAAVINGATEENKYEICDSFASALMGQSSYCSFDRTSSPSLRRLLAAQVLYLEVLVEDVNAASAQVHDGGFIDSLQSFDLPDGVNVIEIFNPELKSICVHTSHWSSRFGRCTSYATRYHSYCNEDWDDTDRSTLARDACPQCNSCVYVESRSQDIPDDPLTSLCANHKCHNNAVLSYSASNGCVCRCKPGRYGANCALASPVWMNEFILKETLEKRTYTIEKVELLKQEHIDTARNSVNIKVIGGSGHLDILSLIDLGAVSNVITEQSINQELSGGIAMFYAGECVQLILFEAVNSIEMEDTIRENLGSCEVSATVLFDGVYLGANQAISYAYHGMGSYLHDFQGPDRAPSSMGSINAGQLVTLVNTPPPGWDQSVDCISLYILFAIGILAVIWMIALKLPDFGGFKNKFRSKDFKSDRWDWLKGFAATGDFVSDVGFCLSLHVNGHTFFFAILLGFLIVATVKSVMLFLWRAKKMFQSSQVIFWRNEMPGGFTIIPVLFVMSGFSPLFYNLITTTNVDFPLNPGLVQDLPREKAGHLVIENVSSILITAIFFSQNEVQPLALLSLAFSCLMTFILLSQAMLDTMMTNNSAPTHVENMVIGVYRIDKDKVQKLSNRKLQHKMQVEVGTEFIVNVWWKRTFEKNAEIYMILESFADEGPAMQNEIDPASLRKQVAVFVGRLHGADHATYVHNGERRSVWMKREILPSASNSPTAIHMSQIWQNDETTSEFGERDSHDIVVNVGGEQFHEGVQTPKE